MKPSIIITIFISVLLFTYINGLYNTNKELKIDNDILENELLEKDGQNDSLTKLVYTLEKRLEKPKPIKVKKKTKIIVEKPTLPVVKDTIINVIDTLSN